MYSARWQQTANNPHPLTMLEAQQCWGFVERHWDLTSSLREGILLKEPSQEASATPNTGCKAQGGHLAKVTRTPAAFPASCKPPPVWPIAGNHKAPWRLPFTTSTSVQEEHVQIFSSAEPFDWIQINGWLHQLEQRFILGFPGWWQEGKSEPTERFSDSFCAALILEVSA